MVSEQNVPMGKGQGSNSLGAYSTASGTCGTTCTFSADFVLGWHDFVRDLALEFLLDFTHDFTFPIAATSGQWKCWKHASLWFIRAVTMAQTEPEWQVFESENVVPDGYRLMTINEAQSLRQEILSEIGSWYICKLDGGKIDGRGYGGKVQSTHDNLNLGHLIAIKVLHWIAWSVCWGLTLTLWFGNLYYKKILQRPFDLSFIKEVDERTLRLVAGYIRQTKEELVLKRRISDLVVHIVAIFIFDWM